MRGVIGGGFLALVISVEALLGGTASCDRALRRLQGWTIVKVGTIKGNFEGCDHDRLIEFDDGTILRCSSYGYQYAYHPDAIVFAKSASVNGQAFTMVKMLVDGDVYDMAPVTFQE
jgi:hypothetical protein